MLNLKTAYEKLWKEILRISEGEETDPELVRDLIAYEWNYTDKKTQDSHIARMIRLGFLVWDKEKNRIKAVGDPPIIRSEEEDAN